VDTPTGTTHYGVQEIDTDGRITYTNTALDRILGCRPGEALGRHAWELFTGDQQDQVREHLTKILREWPHPGAWVGKVLARDERVVDIEVEWDYRRTAEGRPVGLVSVIADVTVRVEADRALRESESKYRELTDSLPESVFEIDLAGRLTFLNRAAVARWGYSLTDVAAGLNAFDLLEPDGRDTVVENIRRVIAGDRSGREYLLRGKDGTVSPVLILSSPIMQEGRPVGLRGLLVDMTESRRAAEASRESAEWFNKAFQASPAPTTITLAETGQIIDVNSQLLNWLGFTREEIIGRTATELHLWTGSDHRRRFLDALHVDGATRDFPGSVVTKSGEVRQVAISAELLTLGGRQCVLALFSDVTEQRRLQTQLLQAQKLQSIGQLAAGIAHEINTPIQFVGDNLRFLNESFATASGVFTKYEELISACRANRVTPALLAEVDAVERGADLAFLAAEIPAAIAQSLEGVARVATIVAAMKDFGHPDSSEKVAVDVNTAIETTVTVARNEWKYHADVNLELDRSIPPVPCRAGELNQVILNLLVNAAHAVADVVGDRHPSKGLITIATRRDGEWAEIRVADTGTGIPEEIRHRIFDPFFTTKPVGQGTGQGLALARAAVVEKHGGTLTFETEIGQGTTFIVRLPLHDPAADPN
jgi:PAS domain S-box-containing protein